MNKSENIVATLKGNKLTLVIDLSKRGDESTSGKTVRVAQMREQFEEGEEKEKVTVQLNCWVKK